MVISNYLEQTTFRRVILILMFVFLTLILFSGEFFLRAFFHPELFSSFNLRRFSSCCLFILADLFEQR